MSLQERKQILKGEMNEKIAGGEKNDFDRSVSLFGVPN